MGSLLIDNTGNYYTYNNQSLLYQPGGINFVLSVIRNKEMNNTVGNAGSTNLTISAVNGNILTVSNMPIFYGFTQETSTWICKNTTNNSYTALATNIDSVGGNITLDNAYGFNVGNTISLYNPFINYQFSGNQITSPSIPLNFASWASVATGGGPIYKDGSIYKWLFFGQNSTPANQVGLATSTDMQTWNVSNGLNPVITLAQTGSTSCWLSGNIVTTTDGSLCAVLNANISGVTQIKMAYFDKNASSLTFGNVLRTNAGYGAVTKIGSLYHMLYTDLSTGTSNRCIVAAYASNLDGPYTSYQNIIYGNGAPAGTAYSDIAQQPLIINDGYKVFALFGGEGTSDIAGLLAGVGSVNTEFCQLDFNVNTSTWSVDNMGPVIINPIDFSLGYNWAVDHCGSNLSTFIDGSTCYLGITMNGGVGYQATMLKLKQYTQ